MDKRSIFERGFAILLSVILMAACFPLSIFAEDTTQDPDFSGTESDESGKRTAQRLYDDHQPLRL